MEDQKVRNIQVLDESGSIILMVDVSDAMELSSLIDVIGRHRREGNQEGEFVLYYLDDMSKKCVIDDLTFRSYLHTKSEYRDIMIYLSNRNDINEDTGEILEVEIIGNEDKKEDLKIKPPNIYMQDHSEVIQSLQDKGYLNEEILAEKITSKLKETLDSKFSELSLLLKPSNSKNPYDEMTSSFNLFHPSHNEPHQSQDITSSTIQSFDKDKQTSKDRMTYEFQREIQIEEESKESIRKSSFDSTGYTKSKIPQSMYDIKPKQFNEALVFNTQCSLCLDQIIKNKYQCLICLDLIVCPACEPLHDHHPMVKYKDNEISKIEDCMIFMEAFKKERSIVKKYLDVSIFDKKYKLKLDMLSYSFSMRPNKRIPLSICITNELKSEIPKGTLIIAKNTKTLKVENYLIKSMIKQKESFEIDVDVYSSSKIDTYDLEFLCYNRQVKVDCEVVKIHIEVNEDLEEERINEELAMFSKLLTLRKSVKVLIYRIIKEGLSDKHPYVIYEVLKRHDYKLDLSLNVLLNMNEGNQNKETSL